MSGQGGPAPQERDAWRVRIPADSDKVRTCVILSRDTLGRFEIAYGRGTAQAAGKHVRVRHGSVYSKALGLSKDTHFWAEDIGYVFEEHLLERICRCPPGLFTDLEELAESPECTVRRSIVATLRSEPSADVVTPDRD